MQTNISPHKDMLEFTIESVLNRLEKEISENREKAKKEDGKETVRPKLSQADKNKIFVAAQVMEGLEKYRNDGDRMNTESIRSEDHKSERLRKHLKERFGFEPNDCHAHAIVSGRQPLAAVMRAAMAQLGIRIDDADNGCWLPENTAATPHPVFPAAPPHSRIHRYNYYFWINSKLQGVENVWAFRSRLNVLSKQLYTGKMEPYVLLKKGDGLPPGANKK